MEKPSILEKILAYSPIPVIGGRCMVKCVAHQAVEDRKRYGGLSEDNQMYFDFHVPDEGLLSDPSIKFAAQTNRKVMYLLYFAVTSVGSLVLLTS